VTIFVNPLSSKGFFARFPNIQRSRNMEGLTGLEREMKWIQYVSRIVE